MATILETHLDTHGIKINNNLCDSVAFVKSLGYKSPRAFVTMNKNTFPTIVVEKVRHYTLETCIEVIKNKSTTETLILREAIHEQEELQAREKSLPPPAEVIKPNEKKEENEDEEQANQNANDNEPEEKKETIDHDNVFDPENKILKIEGIIIDSIFLEQKNKWRIFLRAKHVAISLGYSDTNKAIREHVDPENKFTLQDLKNKYEIEHRKDIKTTSLYLNIAGFFNLIHNSTKNLSKRIRRWVDNDVMPSVIQDGEYRLDKETLLKVFTPNDVEQYANKSVVYIGRIDTGGEETCYKFGNLFFALRRINCPQFIT